MGERIELRYFDCLGRGETLRYLLRDSAVEFEEFRVPLDEAGINEWLTEHKQDLQKSGYFKALPILNVFHKDGSVFTLSQSLAIGIYLAEKLGYFDGFSLEERSHNLMIATAAYEDITTPVNMLIWSPIRNPRAIFDEEYHKLKQTLEPRLRHLSSLLGELEYFTKGKNASLADFFALYAFQKVHLIFTREFLESNYPNLVRHQQRMEARANLAKYLAVQPTKNTGSPAEQSVLASLSELRSNNSS